MNFRTKRGQSFDANRVRRSRVYVFALRARIMFLHGDAECSTERNTEFSKSSGSHFVTASCSPRAKKERNSGGKQRQISRQMLKIVHSTNETNIQRARLTKKESAKERENGGGNNWKTIPGAVSRNSAALCAANLLHCLIAQTRYGQKKKKKKKKGRDGYLKDPRSLVLIFFFVASLVRFCSSV